MLAEHGNHITLTAPCSCCELPAREDEVNLTCEQRQAIFTPRELAILNRIREVREQARQLKESIEQYRAAGTAYASGLGDAQSKLDLLRKERADLETQRIAAKEERMRLLGHAD